MLRVACHMSHALLFIYLLDKVVKLVGGGSVIKGATLSSLFIFTLELFEQSQELTLLKH